MKINKIFLVLIATVAIIATLAINTFASRAVGYHQDSYNYLPNVSTFDDLTYNRTSLPNNNNSITDGIIARAGDINNSVRIICGAYSDTVSIHNDFGYLQYTMISAQPFQFTIDFGSIASNLFSYREYYPDLNWSVSRPYNIAVSAQIGLAENAFNDGSYVDFHGLSYNNGDYDFATNGTAFDDYGNMTYFSEVPSNYNISLDQGFYFDYPNSFSLANNITGKFYQSFEAYANYYVAVIRITTYHNRSDGLSYFINRYYPSYGLTLADLNYSTPRLIRDHIGDDLYDSGFREGETVGYNNGYLNGKSDGLTEGRADGYSQGYDEGFDYGLENAIEERGMFKFFIDSLGAFMDFPIFTLPEGGSITLGLLLGVIVGAMSLVWLLKLIAGG